MIIVIGAGISGLSLARELGGRQNLLVFEKNKYYGGLSTQYSQGNYHFDYGGHYFHFQNQPRLAAELNSIYPFGSFQRRSRVLAGKRLIPYPIQFHSSRLPGKIRKNVVSEMMTLLASPPGKAANLRLDLAAKFGPTLCSYFFYPFLEKFYGLPLEEISADMDKGTIPVPDRKKVLAGAAGKDFSETGYNASFLYPRNGLRHFIEAYARPVVKYINREEEILEVDPDRKKVYSSKKSYDYSHLINTIPLKDFLGLCRNSDLQKAGRRLRHISTLVINMVLKRRRRRFHWLYLPEKDLFGHRIGFYPYADYTACYLEKTVRPDMPLNPETGRREALETLRRLGLIEKSDELILFSPVLIPVSYIVFDHNWQSCVPGILADLEKNDVFCSGRFATWNYSSMSADIIQAEKTAKKVIPGVT